MSTDTFGSEQGRSSAMDAVIKEAAEGLQSSMVSGVEIPPAQAPAEEELAAPPAAPAKPPKVEPPPEPTPPPKSKRDIFRERAEAEKKHRDKESRLKEREAEVQRMETALREFQADPLAYLEKQNPRVYEEWTERKLKAGLGSDNGTGREVSVLKQEIAALREEIKTKYAESDQAIKQAQYAQWLADARGTLLGEDYKDIHESAALFQEFSGRPADLDLWAASVWSEYKTKYPQAPELTPQEVCEIMLEDARAHLATVPKSERLKRLFAPPPAPEPKRKRAPSAPTLTAEQQSQSASAPEVDLSAIKDKEELLKAAAKMIEYE